MSANKSTDEFKREALAKVGDRGYPVCEVAQRLGVRTKTICTLQPAPGLPSVKTGAPRVDRCRFGLGQARRARKPRPSRFFWQSTTSKSAVDMSKTGLRPAISWPQGSQRGSMPERI